VYHRFGSLARGHGHSVRMRYWLQARPWLVAVSSCGLAHVCVSPARPMPQCASRLALPLANQAVPSHCVARKAEARLRLPSLGWRGARLATHSTYPSCHCCLDCLVALPSHHRCSAAHAPLSLRRALCLALWLVPSRPVFIHSLTDAPLPPLARPCPHVAVPSSCLDRAT
jgi:hypothetical protein